MLDQPASELGMPGDPAGDPVQRVDHRVAGDVDRAGRHVLAPQRLGRRLGRREVKRGDRADNLAVDLLGPGLVDVAAPQARLDMGDGILR